MKKLLAILCAVALVILGGLGYAYKVGWLSWQSFTHNVSSLRTYAAKRFKSPREIVIVTPTSTGSDSAVFDEKLLKNLVLEINGHRVQLKDGEGEYVVRTEIEEPDPRGDPDGKGIPYDVVGSLEVEHLALGDLDGDEKLDAILVVGVGDVYSQESTQKVFIVMNRAEGPHISLSNAVILLDGDRIDTVAIQNQEIIVNLSLSKRGTRYDEKVMTVRKYRDHDGGLENIPLYTIGRERSLLELARMDVNSGQLISPDGEWMLAFEKSGDVPLSRSVNYYLVLRNLKGKADRYLYLDWSLRPEDEDTEAYPLGWSKDGRYVYLSFFKPLKSKEATGPYKGYWYPFGYVAYLDLDSRHSYWNQNVRPVNSDGVFLMDAIPTRDVALGQLYVKDEKVTTTLVLFPMTPRSSSSTVPVLELPAKDHRTVVSAMIDRCEDKVGYVLHQPGKDDEVYQYDANTKQRERIDLAPYREELRKQGITSPYRIQIQKVWMCKDLILTITGSTGKSTVKRWMRSYDSSIHFIQE